MSSDPPSGAPSSEAERRERHAAGHPRERELRPRPRMIARLRRHRRCSTRSSTTCRAPASMRDATASYAFAAAVELGFERGRAEAVRESGQAARHRQDLRARAACSRGRARRAGALTTSERSSTPRFDGGPQLAARRRHPGAVSATGSRARSASDFDGSGAGAVSAGERIPLESRIVAGSLRLRRGSSRRPARPRSPHERRAARRSRSCATAAARRARPGAWSRHWRRCWIASRAGRRTGTGA